MKASSKYKNPICILNEMYPSPNNPVYECRPLDGSGIRPIYLVTCKLEGYEYEGRGKTKKDAKMEAAFKVLEDLDALDHEYGYEYEGKIKKKQIKKMFLTVNFAERS